MSLGKSLQEVAYITLWACYVIAISVAIALIICLVMAFIDTIFF